jgi:hypothetical protein
MALVLVAGCGLESVFVNAGHDQYARPASTITGTLPMGVTLSQLTVIDGAGKTVMPFATSATGSSYELQLPSQTWSMLRVRADSGNVELRAIVPAIAELDTATNVDLDARNMTETLIVEARLSADGSSLAQVTPSAYLGTRMLIRAALDQPGPTQDLLHMVESFLTKYDPNASVGSPDFFNEPVLDTMFAVKTSPIDKSVLQRNPFDYVGDGKIRHDSADFDAKLAAVAQLYRPAGCPDPDHIKLVFAVDFNSTIKNGNCGAINRFTWAVDKPGKSMFFVGWIYTSAGLQPSDINDPDLAKAMGSSTPNTIPMYDDGTNGDETAGDNVWTVSFNAPRSSPGHVLRVGYKYTWGTPGAVWSGSEEWPGNSRILEVVDDNSDDFVYRHDTFGDEATNKDKVNLNLKGSGSIDWTTDLHGCGTPESHENKWDNNSCSCTSVITPKWIGPLTVTCTQ